MTPPAGTASGGDRIPVGLVGPDRAGLELTRAFAAGGRVLAFDVGTAPPAERGGIRNRDDLPAGVEVTNDPDRLGEPDALVVCVRVPVTPARGAETGPLAGAFDVITRRLRPGQLVVLATSVPPGTTRSVVLPRMTARGWVPGRNIFLAHGADPIDPGDFARRAVGGIDPESRDRAVALFGGTGSGAVPVSSVEAAEVYGLLGAASRAVTRGLANELAVLCDRMGADAREVLAAAGLPDLSPGPGEGTSGAALLAWGARRFGVTIRCLELAAEANSQWPAAVVAKVADALNDAGLPVKGSRVLVLGPDPAGAPWAGEGEEWHELTELLLRKGAVVSCHDPDAPELPRTRSGPRPAPTGGPLTAEFLAGQDCVLVAGDHAAYDWEFVVAHSRRVVDPRNATRAGAAGREKSRRA